MIHPSNPQNLCYFLNYNNYLHCVLLLLLLLEPVVVISLVVDIRHIYKWRTCKETMGPSACKRGLWGIVALFSFVFLPHKPRLHAHSPIVLRLSAIYEYGVLCFQIELHFNEFYWHSTVHGKGCPAAPKGMSNILICVKSCSVHVLLQPNSLHWAMRVTV